MFRSNTPPPFEYPRWLAALLIVALSIRLAWCFSKTVDEDAMFRSLPDQREYLSLGRNLLHGKGLSFVETRLNDQLHAYRPPGYPIFIAICGGNVRAVQIVQSILDTSTVLAAVLLARRWLNDRSSLLAGAIVAFNPFLIFFGSLVLTETTFTAALVWGTTLLAFSSQSMQGIRRRAIFFWIGAGLLGLSIHFRTSAIGIALILGIGAFVLRGRHQERASPFAIPIATSLFLMTALLLFPWALRNRIVLGNWIWTSTNEGFTLYDGLNPGADGSSDQSFVTALPQLRAMDEISRSRYLSNAAINWATSNFRRVFELAGTKLMRMWSPVPLSAEFGGKRLYVFAAAIYAVPLFLLAIIGIWRGNLSRGVKVFLLLPAIYFSAVHAMTIGSLRYRVPVEPILAVVASAGISRRVD